MTSYFCDKCGKELKVTNKGAACEDMLKIKARYWFAYSKKFLSDPTTYILCADCADKFESWLG